MEENPSTSVVCRMETNAPRVDHSIPRARGGNATHDNAQTACPRCNASKGARDYPVNPPPGYRGRGRRRGGDDEGAACGRSP
jgi:filamentous hemagglutinin